MTATTITQFLFIFLAPAALLAAEKRWAAARWLGSVVMAYLLGMAFGHMHLLFPNAGLLHFEVESLKQLAGISVLLAIPLMLFSTDFRAWVRHARSTAIAFVIAAFSASAAAVVFEPYFHAGMPEPDKIAGMLTGVFVGGTVNLSSVGFALHAGPEALVVANAADAFASIFFMLFVLFLAKPLLGRFLPPYQAGVTQYVMDENEPKAVSWRGVLKAAALALPVAGIGQGLYYLASQVMLSSGMAEVQVKEYEVIVMVLTVTVLGVLGSLRREIRQIRETVAVGDYLILVFCVAFGLMVDFRQLVVGSSDVFYYALCIVFFGSVMHFLLCRLFRIDVDTAIITSVATILSAPFVSSIAENMKNREIILSGITAGIAGYALGNFAGVAVAWLVR